MEDQGAREHLLEVLADGLLRVIEMETSKGPRTRRLVEACGPMALLTARRVATLAFLLNPQLRDFIDSMNRAAGGATRKTGKGS